MPGTFCCVGVCKSNFNKSKKLGDTIGLFSFPKDKKLREEWIRRCHKNGEFNPKNKRICHKHFKENDFEDGIEARLMNRPAKRLKKSAIPSLHLQKDEQVASSISRADEQELEKKCRKTVEVLIDVSEMDKDKEMFSTLMDLNTPSTSKTAFDELLKKFTALKKENVKLKKQIEEDANSLDFLQYRVSQLETFITQQNTAFEERAKNVFGNFLTPNQIGIALKKRKRKHDMDTGGNIKISYNKIF